MFTIDLLKGHGIPLRSRPVGLTIAAITVAVPMILVISMLGYYFNGRTLLSIQKQKLVNYDIKIEQFSEELEQYKSLEREKGVLANSLSEVKSSIYRHTQWSPVLVTLVQNLPESVVLTELDVKQNFIKKKVSRKDDSEKKDEVAIPVRKLRMNVCGDPLKNCDQAIRDFRDQIRFSDVLGPRLEEIKISQQTGKLDGRSVVLYEIDCLFKAGS